MKIQNDTVALLRCPACHTALTVDAESLICGSAGCGNAYPIINGIPILINESNSIFRLSEYTCGQNTFYELSRKSSGIKRIIASLIPDFALNYVSAQNHIKLAKRLKAKGGKPRILVLGGSVFNWGMEPLLDPEFELIESDVSFGDRTQIVLDGHDIPFEDGTIDVVIVQAVLEHVLDPFRTVQEIHRILKSDGILYAETPFMQQVHAGPFDFTRFTHVGHRRLFRYFDELESGPVVGPAVALGSAWCHFLVAFSESAFTRKLLLAFGQCTIFWVKWFDCVLMKKRGAFDCAFGFYFLGARSETPLPDADLIKSYRGAIELLKPR